MIKIELEVVPRYVQSLLVWGMLKNLLGPYFALLQGYGCMSLTDFYGPNTAAGAEETLKHVLETGVTIINTADLYGPYINQELVN